MTSSDSWKNKENYSYLHQLEGREHSAGWAWEFIRRSLDYRNAYASFIDLQDKYGASWRSAQPDDSFYPSKNADESVNAWKFRVSGMGYSVKPITKSQKIARQWQLAELYDPASPYNAEAINYVAVNKRYPAFYASERVPELPEISLFEDMTHDFLDEGNENVMLVALDATLPAGDQLDKARLILERYAERFTIKKIPNKGQSSKWELYLRFLDARNAHPDMDLVEILNVIGIPEHLNENPHRIASQQYKAARKMINGGYNGLLFKLRHD